MANFLPLDELVSSFQPPLNPPSNLSTFILPDSGPSSLQQTSPISENLNSENVSESNKCASLLPQTLITNIPDKRPVKRRTSGSKSKHGTSKYERKVSYVIPVNKVSISESENKSRTINSKDSSSRLPKTKSSNSNTNKEESLSNVSENYSSASIDESDDEEYVMRKHHFNEILEFCSKIYTPCKCDVCGTAYESFQELLDNCNCHKVYLCSVCDRSFRTRDGLHKHIKRLHSEEPRPKKVEIFDNLLRCETCGKFLRTQKLLNMHAKTCINACHLCDKVYRHKTSLDNHLRNNHSGIRHICDICGKSLISYVNLLGHLRTHKDERNFKCSICSSSFKTKQALKRHNLTHINDRPFLCEFCPKKFTTKCKLSGHLKSHSDERNYKCGECGSAFKTPRDLKRHAYIHSENKPYYCMTCGKGFNQKTLLVRHFKIHPEQSCTELNDYVYAQNIG